MSAQNVQFLTKGHRMSNSKIMQQLSELGEEMQKISEKHEEAVESWWVSLSEEERERAFYAVVKRIFKAEIVDKRSYRGALYDVFGFGEHMYINGMDCGYMAIHNSIVDVDEHYKLQQKNAKLKIALQALLNEEEGSIELAIKALG